MAEKRYDARYGWQYRNHAGDMHSCSPPFTRAEDAVIYALDRLSSDDDSWLSRMIDARAALSWAVERMPVCGCVAREQIIDVLTYNADALYNPFEPDNQTATYRNTKCLLEKMRQPPNLP